MEFSTSLFARSSPPRAPSLALKILGRTPGSSFGSTVVWYRIYGKLLTVRFPSSCLLRRFYPIGPTDATKCARIHHPSGVVDNILFIRSNVELARIHATFGTITVFFLFHSLSRRRQNSLDRIYGCIDVIEEPPQVKHCLISSPNVFFVTSLESFASSTRQRYLQRCARCLRPFIHRALAIPSETVVGFPVDFFSIYNFTTVYYVGDASIGRFPCTSGI